VAIYYFALQSISRAQGRSAVAAAAYRSGTSLKDERLGTRKSYTRRRKSDEIAAEGLIFPSRFTLPSEKVFSRERLWNAAEAAERRKNARVATEITLALPHELSDQSRLALARAYAQMLADRYGVAVDFALHGPSKRGDQRNWHAHLLLTTRQLTAIGFGTKSQLECNEEKRKLAGVLSRPAEIRNLREEWARMANHELEKVPIYKARLDARSYRERGLDIVPTRHLGPAATGLQRRNGTSKLLSISPEAQAVNARIIREQPEQILQLIVQTQSVFTRRDIAIAINRYISDHEDYPACLAAVMSCKDLIALPRQRDREPVTLPDGSTVELPVRYSTRDIVALERKLLVDTLALAQTATRPVSATDRAAAIATLAAQDGVELSPSQQRALEHVTGSATASAIVGAAGKNTLLKAARLAWEQSGYRVFGAALTAKAAQGLAELSGISSATIAALIQSWDHGTRTLSSRDVMVIGEASMIDSRLMARLVAETRKAGARIVLVGDPEQLPAIGAGPPFRALIERIGASQLLEIRRQKEEWAREATVEFSQGRTPQALQRYIERGKVRLVDDPVTETVARYLACHAQGGTQLALAHGNADVRAINDGIREGLKKIHAIHAGRGAVYDTRGGNREFLVGDRIVLLRNARLLSSDGRYDIEVKSGQLVQVLRCEADTLHVRPDGLDTVLRVPLRRYKDIDHGYAVTIHKSQGATVDRTFVVATTSLDRHLTYVAMSRHRDNCIVVASRTDFIDAPALVKALSRHEPKETTLDYLTRRLSPAEQAWIAGSAARHQQYHAARRARQHVGTMLYETRKQAQAMTAAEILDFMRELRSQPEHALLAADAKFGEVNTMLEHVRHQMLTLPPGHHELRPLRDKLDQLTRDRHQRELQLGPEDRERYSVNNLKLKTLTPLYEAALRREAIADRALKALMACSPDRPAGLRREEWLLARMIRDRDGLAAARKALPQIIAIRRHPVPSLESRKLAKTRDSIAQLPTVPAPKPRALTIPPPPRPPTR
jgi:Ti-type conjugative transfer relaxase TraA